MKNAIPLRDIFKYSFLLIVAVSLVTFLGVFMKEPNIIVVSVRVLNTFFMFSVFCIINIGLVYAFEKQKACITGENRGNSKKLFAVGAFIGYLVFLFSHFFNMWLVEQGYIPDSLLHDDFARLGNWVYVFLLIVSVMTYGMVFILHNFIILQHWKNSVELENSRLKSVNADTVNQLLKQQIQPHFLFNALNVLKSLIRKYPDTAETYLLSLSDFLRASVSQSKRHLAGVDEEVKICNDYMDMQKIRFGEAIVYNVNVVNINGVLPVFSLQPLIENAIKHNELTVQSPLVIDIYENGGWIAVKNSLKLKKNIPESSGNGLSNLSERYRLLSGDAVVISQNEREFEVKVKILESQENFLTD